MNNKVLVIGSSSFSGSSFCRWMLDNNWAVWGCARTTDIRPQFLQYVNSKNVDNFTQVQFDLNDLDDLRRVIAIVKEQGIEFIVNFAAQGMVAQSWKYPVDWYRTNVLAQVALHDELRKMEQLKRYVHVTTPEVYGVTDGWIKEGASFAPSTPYAVSRAACDMHLTSFFNAYDFPVVFTRAANVYGPGQQLYRIIPVAMLSAKLKVPMQLHGGGVSSRSFIHIDDVSDATYRIMLGGKNGATYHISTNELISIRSLVESIFERCSASFNDIVEVVEERLGKDTVYSLDSSKLRRELGWNDAISLERGLNETEAWIDNNLELFQTLPRKYVHKP